VIEENHSCYCCHKFKDESCKYKGSVNFCDKTKKSCIKLQGGLLNFGAVYIGRLGGIGCK